jgi:hypothetical protein
LELMTLQPHPPQCLNFEFTFVYDVK